MDDEKKSYADLKSELLESGELFTDTDFPPDMTAINGPESTEEDDDIEWKRPHEICESPSFVVNQATRGDIDQGALGDCWFLAGAAALAASHQKRFQRVVPLDQSFEDGEYTGMFRFNFWWYGEWKEVVVDDFLPTKEGTLMYVKCTEEESEFWPCLLEKAYAKLRGCFENLSGGLTQTAMVDMTGGVSEVLEIKDKENVSPDFYSLLYKSHKMKSMMGASIIPAARRTDEYEREEQRTDGLVEGHAYTVTGFKQIYDGWSNVNLIRLRNPWGQDEWNGPWSDQSFEMENLSDILQEELKFNDKNDGEFWMSYQDFLKHFEQIQVCHLQVDSFTSELTDNDNREDWTETVHHGAWVEGDNAGGCGNSPHESLFWKNPQYFVSLTCPDDDDLCTIIVSLMEKEKGDKQAQIAIAFKIFELTDPEFRPLDDGQAPENALSSAGSTDLYRFDREVTKRFELPPGNYVIIPSTFEPDQEAEFMLRLFTEKSAQSGVLNEETAPPPEVTDTLLDVFERHAGSDDKIDAAELSVFLQEVSANGLGEELTFPVEACRSLIVHLDSNKSGFLNFSEAKKAFREIRAYRAVFKVFDTDGSNTVDSVELGKLFSKLGFSMNQDLVTTIVRRYSGRDGRISLTDFVMVMSRLKTLFASLANNAGQEKGTDEATFSRHEFLQIGMAL